MIGVLITTHGDLGKELIKATEAAAGILSRAGARVDEVKMPASFAAVQDAHHIIQRVEAAAFHERLFEDRPGLYRPNLRQLVEVGLLIPGGDYLRAQKIKGLFRREMEAILRNYDCLLSSATSTSASKGREKGRGRTNLLCCS